MRAQAHRPGAGGLSSSRRAEQPRHRPRRLHLREHGKNHIRNISRSAPALPEEEVVYAVREKMTIELTLCGRYTTDLAGRGLGISRLFEEVIASDSDRHLAAIRAATESSRTRGWSASSDSSTRSGAPFRPSSADRGAPETARGSARSHEPCSPSSRTSGRGPGCARSSRVLRRFGRAGTWMAPVGAGG